MGIVTESYGASAPDTTWPPEQAVLDLLLDRHPQPLRLADVLAALAPRLEHAAIERAATNLTAAELVEVSAGGALVPVPAVLEFESTAGAR